MVKVRGSQLYTRKYGHITMIVTPATTSIISRLLCLPAGVLCRYMKSGHTLEMLGGFPPRRSYHWLPAKIWSINVSSCFGSWFASGKCSSNPCLQQHLQPCFHFTLLFRHLLLCTRSSPFLLPLSPTFVYLCIVGRLCCRVCKSRMECAEVGGLSVMHDCLLCLPPVNRAGVQVLIACAKTSASTASHPKAGSVQLCTCFHSI
jgi:hypothetical protein